MRFEYLYIFLNPWFVSLNRLIFSPVLQGEDNNIKSTDIFPPLYMNAELHAYLLCAGFHSCTWTLLLTSQKQRSRSHFWNYHFQQFREYLFRKKPFCMWGFASNSCGTPLKHVLMNVSMEAGPKNSLDKQQTLLVWSSWVCGTGIGFYILWRHTAAFSKQSTIIRSDKRANSVHSGVKKKHIPLPLSNRFIQHPYVALFSLPFSHFLLHPLVLIFHYSCSFLYPFIFRHQSWGTCTENSVSLFALGMETDGDTYRYTILQPQLHFCRAHNRSVHLQS